MDAREIAELNLASMVVALAQTMSGSIAFRLRLLC